MTIQAGAIETEMNFWAASRVSIRFFQIAGMSRVGIPLPSGDRDTHLVTHTHFGCHNNLVAFTVHLQAPQVLALGCGDSVLEAVEAQLDALLRDQEAALLHIVVCRLVGVAGEALRDFLGETRTHRSGERKIPGRVCLSPPLPLRPNFWGDGRLQTKELY